MEAFCAGSGSDHGHEIVASCAAHFVRKQKTPVLFQSTWYYSLLKNYLVWTRYQMWDAEQDDDAAFERRLDSVVREIGERGKLMTAVAEAVPPQPQRQAVPVEQALEEAPEPAPAASITEHEWPTASAPAAAPAVERAAVVAATPHRAATVAAPEQPCTPSMDAMESSETAHRVDGSLTGNLAELTSFMKDALKMYQTHHDAQLEREEKLEGKWEAQRREIEAKLEAQQREVDAKLAPKPVVSSEQLFALESRLEALHSAQLLSDDELYALEDVSADYIDFMASVGGVVTTEMACGSQVVTKLLKLVALSEGIARDGAFARQARRKYTM